MSRPNPQNRPERFRKIDPADYTPEQETAAAALVATPRGEVRGPFIPLLYSPPLLDRTQALGAFIRYECSIPVRLREFAILVAARHWEQAYEWHAHAALALKAGVTTGVIDALAEGAFPATAPSDEQVIWHFCRQLHDSHFVADASYDAALSLLGKAGVVELTTLCGYYALLAMILNVAHTPCPGAAFATPEA